MNAAVLCAGTIGDALSHQGWHPDSSAPSCWHRETSRGPAVLSRGKGSAGWEVWDLRGGAVPTSEPLTANASIAGPGKLVQDTSGGCHWRSEVPREAFSRHDDT